MKDNNIFEREIATRQDVVGLFHRGLSQSGTFLNPWAFSENNVEKSHGLAANLGCPTHNSAELVECLRSRPAESIVLYSRHLQVSLSSSSRVAQQLLDAVRVKVLALAPKPVIDSDLYFQISCFASGNFSPILQTLFISLYVTFICSRMENFHD
ncbi:unnamed protein product [Bemisia tabaci]|uniref:Carboxylesterase type B domain-containing protein n=1 Tax=Bemisia tabaci TaxID=7038 RepID=A0A9P0AG15_BEMTA|nr:unnamed protein product [Bemisia tabaci]